jgi:hypothetical protein
MSKLNSEEYLNVQMKILEASEEQKKQFKTLLLMPDEQKQTILEMVKAAVKVESEKIAAQYRDKTVKRTPEKVEQKNDSTPTFKRTVKNPRKFEITAPNGVPFYLKIPYSLDRFERFLTKSGLKVADSYSNGIKRMLSEHGLFNGNMSLSLNDLIKLRDIYANQTSSYASNKRGYLRKFNQYLVHEYLTNKK